MLKSTPSFIFLDCTLNDNSLLPSNYTGTISKTARGEKCKKWSQTPFYPEYITKAAQNYCRSPDNDQYGAWCYLKKPKRGVTWGYCSCST